ncbi:MAG: HupE/UreJ family protein [Bacteroidota bacterium]|nr:HupE/UreJ family protein [Bacteroidota bacterium]
MIAKFFLMPKLKIILFLFTSVLIISFSNIIFAHPIHDLDKLSTIDVGWVYLQLGFTHILPYGIDHILFVLGLFLLSPKLKPLLWQISAFTIAHSITLSLAMFNIVNIPSSIVEPIIALSIVFIAVENIVSKDLKPWRIAIIFLFGLIHGLGFAGVLKELGLPQNQFVNALICFNIGVELGQIAVVLIAYFAVGLWFQSKKWYRDRIVIPGSLIIAAIASYWTIQRIFFPE